MMVVDDQVLEHPKFIRAVRLGDSGAAHLWLGLRAFCAQKLTDGYIEPDMEGETRGPRGRERVKALAALRAAGLVHDAAERAACERCRSAPHADGGLWMHDYLQWSESRTEAQARRVSNRDRQRKHRAGSHVSNGVTDDVSRVTEALVTPPHTKPDPSHTNPDLTAAADPGLSGGGPAEAPRATAAATAPAGVTGIGIPSTLEQALALPVCARAEALERDKHMASWVLPHRWPEVAAVSDALTESAGQPQRRLGAYERDAGVRAVVALYAMGYTPGLLVAVARGVPTRKWWQQDGASRGLSSLTPEVVARELAVNPLAQPPSPAVAKALADREARKAQEGTP